MLILMRKIKQKEIRAEILMQMRVCVWGMLFHMTLSEYNPLLVITVIPRCVILMHHATS